MTPGTDGEHARMRADFGEQRLARQIDCLTPRLLAWVRCKLRGPQRAEPHDLVQEAWCRAVARLDTFTGDDDDFAGWMFRIQKLIILEYLRASARWSKVRTSDGRSTLEAALRDAPAALTSVNRQLVRKEQHEKFLARIELLDPEDRTLFELCALERVSRQAAADRIGTTCEAVTKRWQRLRARLAEPDGPLELLG